jgi:predicted RNase H-like nuclease
MGVDGAPGGWVGAVTDFACLRLLYRPRISELFEAAERPEVVGIDMPIGLSDGVPRRADRAARAYLERRRSSVFPAPLEALRLRGDFSDYKGANKLSKTVTGKGLSKQSFALLPKIHEVAEWRAHAVGVVVREVHPEVSFQVLAQDQPLRGGKKSWVGILERQRMLTAVGLEPNLDDDCGPASIDDVLDAIVVAWSAWRIAAGVARSFPEDPAEAEPAIWA